MSSQREGSKKYESAQIGTFFKRTNRDTGELMTDDQGRQLYSLVLGKDVKITINGVPYDKSYFYVNRPDEKYAIMLKNGKITEEEYEEKVSAFQEGGKLSNIVFEVSKVK